MGEETSADTRIVYGIFCLWWDSIDKIALKGDLKGEFGGVPCCPFCQGGLFEYDNLEAFMNGAEEYEKNTYPGYQKLLEWMRGKCFKTLEAARAAYEKANGSLVPVSS